MTSLLDARVRSLRGETAQSRLLAAPAANPASLLDESWRDFIFAEVWNRPGLALRMRYLIAITGAANAADQRATDAYVPGALKTGELSAPELCEAALHGAVYCGWSTGGRIDRWIIANCAALGIQCPSVPPIHPASWDPAEWIVEGVANFEKVMTCPGPPPQTAYFEAGIVNFVFGRCGRGRGSTK